MCFQVLSLAHKHTQYTSSRTEIGILFLFFFVCVRRKYDDAATIVHDFPFFKRARIKSVLDILYLRKHHLSFKPLGSFFSHGSA